MPRPAKISVTAHYEELRKRADYILEDFADFTDGIRVLFLIYRTKEKQIEIMRGDDTNIGKHHQHLRMTVVNGKEELRDAIVSYLDELVRSPLTLRLQLAVNPRDIVKAVREFKRTQLEADYYDETSHAKFYLCIKDRFISALMKPSSRASTRFVIDCDSEEETVAALKFLGANNIDIVKQYRTKSGGTHIVTPPFNKMLAAGQIKIDNIHTDGLLLLAW